MSALDDIILDAEYDYPAQLARDARAELARLRDIAEAAEEMAKGARVLMEYMKDNDLIDCCCDDGDLTTGQPWITCEYHIAEKVLADLNEALK